MYSTILVFVFTYFHNLVEELSYKNIIPNLTKYLQLMLMELTITLLNYQTSSYFIINEHIYYQNFRSKHTNIYRDIFENIYRDIFENIYIYNLYGICKSLCAHQDVTHASPDALCSARRCLCFSSTSALNNIRCDDADLVQTNFSNKNCHVI